MPGRVANKGCGQPGQFTILDEQSQRMKHILLFVMILGATTLSAQWTVSFHQSFLPFAGLGYGFGDRFRVEARVGTDLNINNVTVEGVVTYDLLDKPDYELYAGVGGRSNGQTGFVVPVGLNVYPFTSKRFGFHVEVAGLLAVPVETIGDDSILRGSWGIRYRFLKE